MRFVSRYQLTSPELLQTDAYIIKELTLGRGFSGHALCSLALRQLRR